MLRGLFTFWIASIQNDKTLAPGFDALGDGAELGRDFLI
jgi:hypothetical protein